MSGKTGAPTVAAGPLAHALDDGRDVSAPDRDTPQEWVDGRADRTPVLDVVIPAFNEELRIGPTIEALCRQLAASGYIARIVVVDNGSVDATIETIERVRTHGVTVTVISCRDQGKGAAIRAGVAFASAPFVGFVDADQSTPPEALITGLALLERGWDAVIGSRRALGGQYAVPQPALRRAGSRAFNVAATAVVGRISDTQCGMKIFRTDAVQEIFAASVTDGFAFDVELLARSRAKGLRIMELPVTWSDSEGSTLSPIRDGFAAFHDLLQVHRIARRLSRAAVGV